METFKKWALAFDKTLCYALYLCAWVLFSASLASWYLVDERSIGTFLYTIFLVAGLAAFIISEIPKTVKTIMLYKQIKNDLKVRILKYLIKRLEKEEEADVLDLATARAQRHKVWA